MGAAASAVSVRCENLCLLSLSKGRSLAFLPLNPDVQTLSVYLSSLWQRNRAYLYFYLFDNIRTLNHAHPRYPLALPRPPARSPQRAALPPHARRPQVHQSLQIARRPATRGYPRAQELQPARSCRRRLVKEAPACREQSRARDEVPSAFGRREVCSHGAERAGVCASEKSSPVPLLHEPSLESVTQTFSCAAGNHFQRCRPRGAEGDAAKSAAA